MLAFQHNFARAVVHSLQLACTLNSLKGTQSEDTSSPKPFSFFLMQIFLFASFSYGSINICATEVYLLRVSTRQGSAMLVGSKSPVAV